MFVTVHLNDRKRTARVALTSGGTFEQCIARVQKAGLYDEEGDTRRYIPPKMLGEFVMDKVQVPPPPEATPIGAATLRLVVVTHFDKKWNRTGMYLNGTLVPGHIADWRALATALGALKIPLTVLKEEWTTTLSMQNVPPTYQELEKVAHADRYETFLEPKP